MLFQTILENPLVGLIQLVILALSLGLHESAHAYSAYWLGDVTPKLQGRLTLNPLKHLDPIGSLFIIFAGIGWGKPVVFNPYNLKNPRRDAAIIALAGPATNIVIAVVSVVVIYAFVLGNLPGAQVVYAIGTQIAILNVMLAVFNMLPIDPLDGFKVVGGILSPHLAMKWYETQKYGLYLLLIMLATGAIGRIINLVGGEVLNLMFRFLQ